MREATIFVPTTGPLADLHPPFENYLLDAAGGFTAHPLTYGGWLDEHGNQHTDVCRPYTVATDDETVRRIVRYVLEAFGQQAVYVSYGTAKIWTADNI